jgi:ubiquinone biosynthesis protein
MRERMSPRTMLRNVQAQVEQLPHLANMTRDLLERMSQPHRKDPPPPWRRSSEQAALRVVGGILLTGGVFMAATGTALNSLEGWPAWLMVVCGLYLVVRG